MMGSGSFKTVQQRKYTVVMSSFPMKWRRASRRMTDSGEEIRVILQRSRLLNMQQHVVVVELLLRMALGDACLGTHITWSHLH